MITNDLDMLCRYVNNDDDLPPDILRDVVEEISDLRAEIKQVREEKRVAVLRLIDEKRVEVQRWIRAEIERDKARAEISRLSDIERKAIEQSEDIQTNWASPFELVGMKRKIAELEAEIATLKDELITAHLDTQNAMEDASEWERKDEELKEALRKISEWAEAYPLDIFPEPDWKQVAELLKDGGQSLDCVSAHNMRHVVEGVGKIARVALEAK